MHNILCLVTDVSALSLTIGGTSLSGLTTILVGGATSQPIFGLSIANTTASAIALNRIQFTHNVTDLNENFIAGSYSLGTSATAAFVYLLLSHLVL